MTCPYIHHTPHCGTGGGRVMVGRYLGRYFYLFATQLHYLKMPKEKKNVGRDGEEA